VPKTLGKWQFADKQLSLCRYLTVWHHVAESTVFTVLFSFLGSVQSAGYTLSTPNLSDTADIDEATPREAETSIRV
jgi:hypothetical protein